MVPKTEEHFLRVGKFIKTELSTFASIGDDVEFGRENKVTVRPGDDIFVRMRKQSVALNNPIPHRCFVGHHLGQIDPAALLERLDNTELDEYSDIATLIGIEFDDNTDWGQLTVLELKLLIQLALKQFEAAHDLVGAFLQYNDNTVERGLFYQALNVVLEVALDDDVELDDYKDNFRRMFGNARMDAAMGSADGSVRFFGLTPTSMKLEGLDRHHRLIDSYKKLYKVRAGVV